MCRGRDRGLTNSACSNIGVTGVVVGSGYAPLSTKTAADVEDHYYSVPDEKGGKGQGVDRGEATASVYNTAYEAPVEGDDMYEVYARAY